MSPGLGLSRTGLQTVDLAGARTFDLVIKATQYLMTAIQRTTSSLTLGYRDVCASAGGRLCWLYGKQRDVYWSSDAFIKNIRLKHMLYTT